MSYSGPAFLILCCLSCLLVGGAIWHPDNNNYFSEIEYNELSRDYDECKKENQKIKEDVGKLLIEYYGKPLVWDVFGVTKYEKLLCALQIVLEEEIPIVGDLLC